MLQERNQNLSQTDKTVKPTAKNSLQGAISDLKTENSCLKSEIVFLKQKIANERSSHET